METILTLFLSTKGLLDNRKIAVKGKEQLCEQFIVVTFCPRTILILHKA
jgi:hypothetical protein